MHLPRVLPLVLATGVALPSVLSAEGLATYSETQVIDTPQCSGGLVLDDGSFEAAYGIGDGQPGSATMVQKMALGTATSLDQVCVCFARSQSSPGSDSFPFEVVLYDDDGANNQPGTELGVFSASAPAVPIFPAVKFFDVDLTTSGLVLPGGNVFVGLRWGGGPSHFVCGDRSVGTLQRDLRLSGDASASWTPMAAAFPTTEPRALGVRVDPPGAVSTCTPDGTTLCLNGGRYSVSAQWETRSGAQGAGHAVELSPDTGYFWFFDANNVELVVKVLDACAFSNRYWVFAGGLTDVRVVLQVTDTLTGALRT